MFPPHTPREEPAERLALSYLAEPSLALLSFLFVFTIQHSFETSPWAWVTAGVIHLAAAGSGRWPVPAAGLALVAVGVELFIPAAETTTASIALLINAASAAARNHRFSVALTTAMITGSFVGLVLHLDNFDPTLRSFTPFAVTTLVAVGAALLWRLAAARLSHQREESRLRIEELRLELARELHDTTAQSLSHAAMRAWMAAEDPGVPDATRDELGRIAEDCASAARDLRQLLSSLRDGHPSVIPATILPGPDALTTMIEDQAERLRLHGLIVHTDIRLGAVSPARSATLAKIVREATNNIIKHAPSGSTCWFSVYEEDGLLHGLFVNRTRSKRISAKGLGLIGMEERLRLLNGTAEVSLVNGQWRTHVTLPTGQR